MKEYFSDVRSKRTDFITIITYRFSDTDKMPISHYEYMIRCSYNIPHNLSSVMAAREFIKYFHSHYDVKWDNLPDWLSQDQIDEISPLETFYDYSHLDKVKDWPPAMSLDEHAKIREQQDDKT